MGEAEILRIGRQLDILQNPAGDWIKDDQVVRLSGSHEQFAIRTQCEGLRSHAGQFDLETGWREDLIRGCVPAVRPKLSNRFSGYTRVWSFQCETSERCKSNGQTDQQFSATEK
jgi:hypothetical protein